jgi:hypothetical protein
MDIRVLSEYGYNEAILGFSLSYNTNIDRVKEILPKYAFGVPGEGKFLESMIVYLDIRAPRFWWQEADTYRVGTTKQSESTMHTLYKRFLTEDDFEYPVGADILNSLNMLVSSYRTKLVTIDQLKNSLPEGFLQRRIWMVNYKLLQNIYVQRHNHRLPQWQQFFEFVLSELEHPDFIVKDYHV